MQLELILILSPVKGITLSVHFVQAITKQWIATSINLFELVRIASLHRDCVSIA